MKAKREPKKTKKTPWWIWLILAVAIVAVGFNLLFRWEEYQNELGLLNLAIQFFILIILFGSIRGVRRWVMATIGEGAPMPRRRLYRFLLPVFFAVPFTIYTLFPGTKDVIPQGVGFSPIVIAPVLGGLMLTAAGNKRIKNRARIELISVAQKLIVATVLLIVFAAIFFTAYLFGLADIELNALEWSVAGFFRWAFFWVGVWVFYPGVYLFLFGIFDLVFALRHLRR